MEISIGKTFEFDACHHLGDKCIYGKCSNMHGHTYRLDVEITGVINEHGWICNFADLKQVVSDYVIEKYDHTYINKFIEMPTAENMILDIYQILSAKLSEKKLKLIKLKLYETPTSYAVLKV